LNSNSITSMDKRDTFYMQPVQEAANLETLGADGAEVATAQ